MASSLTPALFPEQQVDDSPASEEDTDANTIIYLATRESKIATSAPVYTWVIWAVGARSAALSIALSDLGTVAVEQSERKQREWAMTDACIELKPFVEKTQNQTAKPDVRKMIILALGMMIANVTRRQGRASMHRSFDGYTLLEADGLKEFDVDYTVTLSYSCPYPE